MNIAIILAGGIGSRCKAKDENGDDIPKQFVKVLGKPVLVYTIEAFQASSSIDAIEVVVLSSYKDYLTKLVKQYHLSKVKWIVDGGSTFQKSVEHGVSGLEGKIKDDDVVLIHFGASPFITDDIISDAAIKAKMYGNAISTTDFYLLPGIKNDSSSVNTGSNYCDKYIDRNTIACMNSPHAFKYAFIRDLYKKANETGVISKVEPHTTSLMFALRKRIFFSKGSQLNIKITNNEDILLFEGYTIAMSHKK